MKDSGRTKQAAQKVKDRIKAQPGRDRGPITIYLDRELFKAFKRECERLNQSASLVLEDFIREFMGTK